MRIFSTWKALPFGVGLLLGILTAPSLSMAANHYVRAGALGNGSGSDWTNAYTDIPTTLVRGDTYYFAAGTYDPNGYTIDTPVSGTETITFQTATPSDHGTDTGWSDSYAGQVVCHNFIIKTSYVTFNGVYRTDWEGSYGMKVELLPPTAANENEAFWLYGQGDAPSHITIQYVDMPGYGVDAPFAQQYGVYGFNFDPGPMNGCYEYLTLSHDYIHDEGAGSGPISLNCDYHVLVEYTEIARYVSTPNWHSEAVTDQGEGGYNTYRYNRFIDNSGTGVIVTPSGSTAPQNIGPYYIYGNLFWQKDKVSPYYLGNGIISCINNKVCSNWYIYNNTIVGFGGSASANGINWYFSNPGSTNVQVKNNIWLDSTNVSFSTSARGQINHDYNYFINSTGFPTESHGATGSTDPFIDAANGNFHLTTETKDGLHLLSPYDMDPDGVKRGSDNGIWSRGAYQYNPKSASSVDPPTNLTVGSVY